jgi:hypothetical protein
MVFFYLYVFQVAYKFTFIFSIQIDGCYDFSINSSEILGTGRYFYGRAFNIRASVVEAGTGM